MLATERRRVQKLKEAYTMLDDLVRSRPDILNIQREAPAAVAAGARGRKRGRQDEEGGGSQSGTGSGSGSECDDGGESASEQEK